MGFFSRPKKQKIAVQSVLTTEIRLEQWRSSPELVVAAQRLRKDPTFRAIMDVLRTESPANYGLPVTGVSPEDRCHHASKIEGYNLALNNLEAMFRFNQSLTPLEATFEAEEQPSEAIQ